MIEVLPRAFQFVVLDFDGTLADTRPAIIAALAATFSDSNGVKPNHDALHAAVGRGLPLDATLKHVAAALGLPCDDPETARLVDVYRTQYPDHAVSASRPFAGFDPVLRQLKASQTAVAVVSNKGEAAIKTFLDHHGLADLVDFVLGDAPRRPRKPDAALLLNHVLPRAGRPPLDQVLVVGDTDVDLEFARNSGVASCWARFGYGDATACAALSPDFTIDKPAELTALLGRRQAVQA
ncbi:MAG: HAD family hydrolase [Alphaproteobacteria bacterium]